jgi:hypothetical protein
MSALHAEQVLAEQMGVVPLHCASLVQSPTAQAPLGKQSPSVPHCASPVQAMHALPLQMGVVPLHSPSLVHWTHWFVVASQPSP